MHQRKLFPQMFTGSLFGSGPNIFATLSWCIMNADRDGFIEVDPCLLAKFFGAEEASIVSALTFLQQPDDRSASKVQEGRRLVHDGGYIYRVVNSI